jgi:NADH-quinone oxidoreductase subunit A
LVSAMNVYGNIFVFFAAALLFVLLIMSLVKIVAPRRPNREKNATYECGEEPVGSGWLNFNARFYLIAILFIIFDVEIVLVFPVVVRFREALLAGNGMAVFLDIFVFAAVLFLGLVYAWKNGYLEWLRGVRKQLRVEGRIATLREWMAEEAREQGKRRLAAVQARIKARLAEESGEEEQGNA